MSAKTLRWKQVNAWRLAQQCLEPRRKRRGWVDAVTRIGGVQAQVLSAAKLALWARVDNLTQDDIDKALWHDHTLVKTWAMRGTLHLLSTTDLALYVAARSQLEGRNFAGYFAYHGFTPAEQQALLDAVPQVLGEHPMTREQLATQAAQAAGVPKLREFILSSSWGAPLMPSAFRGQLAFGPSQGQNVTFVNPQKWMAPLPTIEPSAALQQIVRLYLKAYGPATPEDFARWWWGGGGITLAKKMFRSLGEELVAVNIEGWQAFALGETLESIRAAEPPHAVHLLPMFDSYTFALGRGFESHLQQPFKARVFRPQGWISAVVLVNGVIKGVWQTETQRAQTVIQVKLFSPPPTAALRKGISAEAERLGAFLNTKIVVAYE